MHVGEEPIRSGTRVRPERVYQFALGQHAVRVPHEDVQEVKRFRRQRHRSAVAQQLAPRRIDAERTEFK